MMLFKVPFVASLKVKINKLRMLGLFPAFLGGMQNRLALYVTCIPILVAMVTVP